MADTPEGTSHLFTLSYDQPAGTRHVLPPLPYLDGERMSEPILRVGIIVDPRKGRGNDFYISKLKIYDPSRFYLR